jgi:hypothetical protein
MVATIASIRSLRASVESTKEKLESEELKAVLREGGVNEVGDLLLRTFGDISVADYVADETVAGRVDEYLGQIIDYLGTDQSVAAEADQVLQIREGRDTPEPDTPAVRAALERQGWGAVTLEPWMQLAEMRRRIELELREVVEAAGIEMPELSSAGRLLGVLRKHGLIHPMAYDDLRIATAVANQALHGGSPSEDEAAEALYLASRALESLR